MLNESERQLIEQVKAAEAKATPGPWSCLGPYDFQLPGLFFIDRLRSTRKDGKTLAKGRRFLCHEKMSADDADFVEISRNSLPALLAIIERLEAEYQLLREDFSSALADRDEFGNSLAELRQQLDRATASHRREP